MPWSGPISSLFPNPIVSVSSLQAPARVRSQGGTGDGEPLDVALAPAVEIGGVHGGLLALPGLRDLLLHPHLVQHSNTTSFETGQIAARRITGHVPLALAGVEAVVAVLLARHALLVPEVTAEDPVATAQVALGLTSHWKEMATPTSVSQRN